MRRQDNIDKPKKLSPKIKQQKEQKVLTLPYYEKREQQCQNLIV